MLATKIRGKRKGLLVRIRLDLADEHVRGVDDPDHGAVLGLAKLVHRPDGSGGGPPGSGEAAAADGGHSPRRPGAAADAVARGRGRLPGDSATDHEARPPRDDPLDVS